MTIQSFTGWWINNYMGWGEFRSPPIGPMPNCEEKMRNPMAKEVRTPTFRPRVVKPLKGKGSYNRKAKSDE